MAFRMAATRKLRRNFEGGLNSAAGPGKRTASYGTSEAGSRTGPNKKCSGPAGVKRSTQKSETRSTGYPQPEGTELNQQHSSPDNEKVCMLRLGNGKIDTAELKFQNLNFNCSDKRPDLRDG